MEGQQEQKNPSKEEVLYECVKALCEISVPIKFKTEISDPIANVINNMLAVIKMSIAETEEANKKIEDLESKLKEYEKPEKKEDNQNGSE